MTNLDFLLNSMEKAKNEDMKIFESGSPIDPGYVVVNGEKAYNIFVNEKREIAGCDCPHHIFRGQICKHIIKVSMEKGLNIGMLTRNKYKNDQEED